MNRKGSNSVQVRRYNERVVLEALQRMGTGSKAELARSTRLSSQAVASIVDALADAGLVELRGRRTGQIGQPSSTDRLPVAPTRSDSTSDGVLSMPPLSISPVPCDASSLRNTTIRSRARLDA
jgi:predicted transcriptional regulator